MSNQLAVKGTSSNGLNEQTDDGILHSGSLHKVGGNVKSWKKRFMVLRKDHCIYYYKSAMKPPLGVIPLTDECFTFRTGNAGDCNWPKTAALPCTIIIKTAERTYYLFAETLQEADHWKEHLSKVEKIRKLKLKIADDPQGSAIKKKLVNKKQSEESDVSSISANMSEFSESMMTEGVYASLNANLESDRSGTTSPLPPSVPQNSGSGTDELYIECDNQELHIEQGATSDQRSSKSVSPSDAFNINDSNRKSIPLPPTPLQANIKRFEESVGQDSFSAMYESIGSAKRPLSAMELSTTSVSGEDGKQRRSLAQLPPLPPKEISEAEPIVQTPPEDFEPEDDSEAFYAAIENDPVDSTSEAQNTNNSLESSLEVKPPIPAPRSKSRSPILHAYENSAVCHTAAVHTEVITSDETYVDVEGIDQPKNNDSPKDGEEVKAQCDTDELYELPRDAMDLSSIPLSTSGYIGMTACPEDLTHVTTPAPSKEVHREASETDSETDSTKEYAPEDGQSIDQGTSLETEMQFDDLTGTSSAANLCVSKHTEEGEKGYKTVKVTAKDEEDEPGYKTIHKDSMEGSVDTEDKESSDTSLPNEKLEDEIVKISEAIGNQDIKVYIEAELEKPATSQDEREFTSMTIKSRIEETEKKARMVKLGGTMVTTENTDSETEGSPVSLARRSGSIMFRERQSQLGGDNPSAVNVHLKLGKPLTRFELEQIQQQLNEERQKVEREKAYLEVERRKLAEAKRQFEWERREFRRERNAIQSKLQADQ